MVDFDEVLALQRFYPQIYLACHLDHVRRKSTAFGLTSNESSLLAHLDLVFILYQGAKDESRFRSVIPLLNDANAVWVIFRKGPSGPGETNITTLGRRSGPPVGRWARCLKSETSRKSTRFSMEQCIGTAEVSRL